MKHDLKYEKNIFIHPIFSIEYHCALGTNSYSLPKTALRFSVLVEKTTFTPGKYARFSERYLKTPVKDTPTTTYRIVSTKMNTYAVPDSSKQFTATIDKKHSIISVSRDQNGVIMAVNSEPLSLIHI